jgi:Na+-translocating ferredoxin:NAD+ oxidoreductase RnfC subunit
LREVNARFGSIGILSDDYRYAEKLKNDIACEKIVNLTPENLEGYRLSQSKSVNDVERILENFILLASSPACISCPSSNLVNASNWARSFGANQKFDSINPIEKYIIF